MPVNKNAYTRYLILDECLRNKFARFTLGALLKKLNEELNEKGIEPIGRTQFYSDLNYMETDLGAPITRQQYGQSKRVFYEDPNFSIKNQTLEKSKLFQIRDGLELLLQFKGLSNLDELEELLPRLNSDFELDKNTRQIIAFEDNPYLEGIHYLNPLISYIKNKTQLKISYQSFKSQVVHQWDISPYFLKRYNQRWFLFGQVKKYDDLTNVPLDRIQEIQMSNSSYESNSKYNWNEYFEEIIGVSKPKGGKVEKVVLKFTPAQAPYVKSKPLHGSQKKVMEDESGYTISIEVIKNFELQQVINSFGEDVEVL